jgi:hypothetical protein
MGGSAEQVEVIRFGHAALLEGVEPTVAGSSRQDVMHSHGDGRFDARRAVCSVAADQQLLVTVLEVGGRRRRAPRAAPARSPPPRMARGARG